MQEMYQKCCSNRNISSYLSCATMKISEHQLFDRNLNIADLALQLPGLASSDASSDDRPGHIACTSKGCFGRNEHVGNILHSQQLALSSVKKEERENIPFPRKEGEGAKEFRGAQYLR